MTPVIAVVAIIAERLFGYPAFLQNRFRHPVQWLGAVIAWLEAQLNQSHRTARERRLAGMLALLALLAVTGLVSGVIVAVLHTLPFGWVVEALLASALLAQTQLGCMVRAVATGLSLSLAAGREAVSHIVGRDVSRLNTAEVSRAAIETLAENASDGVIAPLFWLVLFGLPGIAIYKAINTADSMIGHMDARYLDYGWASAKCDDVVNWIPARLTALLFVLAALVTPGASPRNGVTTILRDAGKHRSPNAGWPESAMAGALGFGLGGPRAYEGEMVDLPQMGQGNRNLGNSDILRALALYWRALYVVGGMTLCLAIVSLLG